MNAHANTQLDIDLISLPRHRPPGPLPRPTPEEVALARQLGIVPAVVVRPSSSNPLDRGYVLAHGVRHWMLAQQAEIYRIDAVIRDDLTEQEAYLLLKQDLQGALENPIEEARALQAQLEAIDSPRKNKVPLLAGITGISYQTLHHKLRLLKLAPQVQEWVAQGKLSTSLAKPLVRLSTDKQVTLGQQAVKEGWTVRQLQAAINNRAAPANAPDKDPNILRLERTMTEALGFQYHIKTKDRGGRRGQVVIRYDSLEELEHINERLLGGARHPRSP